MNSKTKESLIQTLFLFVLFFVFTDAILLTDRQAIGPESSVVGLATINSFFFSLSGYQPVIDTLTDVVLVTAIAEMGAFAVFGLYQLIKNRGFKGVSLPIYLLAGLYVLLACAYLVFEHYAINFRPVLVDGALEASYPSSHVLLAVTVFGSGMLAFRKLFPELKNQNRWLDLASWILIVIMVIGRLFSGMHWFTDVAGALLLAGSLISLYRFMLLWLGNRTSLKVQA